MSQKKQVPVNRKLIIILTSFAFAWLLLLTAFSIWAWNQHIWQAEVDSEAIHNLMIENASQQAELDALNKQPL